MLLTPVLHKRSNPSPCDLKWHLPAQCCSDLACVTTALSPCPPACAQVLLAAPQQKQACFCKQPEIARSQNQLKLLPKHKGQNTPKLPPYMSELSNWKVSIRLTVCTSIYLFADVNLQNKQLGDVWLVSGCQFQETQAFLSSELTFQVNTGFGVFSIFFQARKALS